MSLRTSLHVLIVAAAAGPAAQAIAQTTAPQPPPSTESSSEINKPFLNPDVDQYVKRFESESREVYTRRNDIVKAMKLVPGMAVADVGAGTGLFTRLFADRVGPKGRVYAVDVSAPFLKHISSVAKRQGHSQIQTVQGTQDSINLPQGTVDVAFLSDTYHHLEHPEKVLASIHRALRPGSRLVVVEFDRRSGVSTDFVMKHVRADKAQFLAEIAAAGFEPIKNPDPPRLNENFFAEFRRLDWVKTSP